VLNHDTLADAVRMPAHPTQREGVKAIAAPSGAVARAGATMVQGNAAPVRTPAAAPAGAVSAPRPSAADGLPLLDNLGGASGHSERQHGFQPPALELGLDGADVMTRLPSSIWDAPPQAGAGATQLQAAAPRHGGDIELPGASAESLDLGDPIGGPAVEEPLDLPSMPAPGKGRTPLSQARPQPARERPQRDEPQREPPRARVGRAGAAKLSKKDAEPVREAPPFWPSAPQAFALPFAGAGGAWLGLIVLWALAAALLSAASMLMVVLGVVVAFCAYTTLLALACDYFRACFWLAEEGGGSLAHAPSLAPSRIFHSYLKSGAHLAVFALAAGLPLIFVTIAGIGEGATPLEVIAEPTTWLLGLIPALLWPAAVAMTALENRYEAIWHLGRAFGVALRAPLEYLAVASAGAFIFGVGVWLLLALASAAGISGVLLGVVLGPPMALSHGVQGALMGYLMRARPELFR
jgi:hypothetical protein